MSRTEPEKLTAEVVVAPAQLNTPSLNSSCGVSNSSRYAAAATCQMGSYTPSVSRSKPFQCEWRFSQRVQTSP
jgi:hypothetical protein